MRSRNASRLALVVGAGVIVAALVSASGVNSANAEGAAAHRVMGAAGIVAENAETGRVAVKRYQQTRMASYVEYNPSTCAQISSGSWSVNSAPTRGTVTSGTFSGHLASGDCPATTFTFGAIYYRWTQHNNKSKTDAFNATWTSPSFNEPFSFFVTVPLVRPIGETTTFISWDSVGTGQWRQKLTPPAADPTFDFSGETVQEAAGGPGGPDTCWFSGSAFGKFTSITGGTWSVVAGNMWGYDHVGWFTTAIKYYRKKGRAPCGTTFPQKMTIKSPADAAFAKYGTNYTLGGSFTKTAVTSKRAGSQKTRVFP